MLTRLRTSASYHHQIPATNMKLPNRMRQLGIVYVLGFGLTARLLPIPIPSLSLKNLSDNSDLIIVAYTGSSRRIETATKVINSHLFEGWIVAMPLKAIETLKGTAPGLSIEIQYFVPDSPGGSIGFRSIPEDQFRLLFLRYNGDAYTLTSPYYPSLPAVQSVHIWAETCFPRSFLWSVKPSNLPMKVRKLRREAIWNLSGHKQPCIQSSLKSAFTSQDKDLRLTAAAALLQRNDVSVLPDVLRQIRDLPQESYLRWNALFAIRDGVSDEKATNYLIVMLQADDPLERRSAASALRRIGNRRAEIALAKALDDTDKDTRFVAVSGLSRIANIPSEEPSLQDFNENETPYIIFWKNWSAKNLR